MSQSGSSSRAAAMFRTSNHVRRPRRLGSFITVVVPPPTVQAEIASKAEARGVHVGGAAPCVVSGSYPAVAMLTMLLANRGAFTKGQVARAPVHPLWSQIFVAGAANPGGAWRQRHGDVAGTGGQECGSGRVPQRRLPDKSPPRDALTLFAGCCGRSGRPALYLHRRPGSSQSRSRRSQSRTTANSRCAMHGM